MVGDIVVYWPSYAWSFAVYDTESLFIDSDRRWQREVMKSNSGRGCAGYALGLGAIGQMFNEKGGV